MEIKDGKGILKKMSEVNITVYVDLYEVNPLNQAMPIIARGTYEVTFVTTFEDNSTSTASALVVAG